MSFDLYQVSYGRCRTPQGIKSYKRGEELVDDYISTVDEAHEKAEEFGPGHYIVVNTRRSSGNNVVDRFTVGRV